MRLDVWLCCTIIPESGMDAQWSQCWLPIVFANAILNNHTQSRILPQASGRKGMDAGDQMPEDPVRRPRPRLPPSCRLCYNANG